MTPENVEREKKFWAGGDSPGLFSVGGILSLALAFAAPLIFASACGERDDNARKKAALLENLAFGAALAAASENKLEVLFVRRDLLERIDPKLFRGDPDLKKLADDFARSLDFVEIDPNLADEFARVRDERTDRATEAFYRDWDKAGGDPPVLFATFVESRLSGRLDFELDVRDYERGVPPRLWKLTPEEELGLALVCDDYVDIFLAAREVHADAAGIPKGSRVTEEGLESLARLIFGEADEDPTESAAGGDGASDPVSDLEELGMDFGEDVDTDPRLDLWAGLEMGEADPLVAVRALTDLATPENGLSGFPPYWFYLGHALERAHRDEDAALAFGKFEELRAPVFSKDAMRAEAAKFLLADAVEYGHFEDVSSELDAIHSDSDASGHLNVAFAGAVADALGDAEGARKFFELNEKNGSGLPLARLSLENIRAGKKAAPALEELAALLFAFRETGDVSTAIKLKDLGSLPALDFLAESHWHGRGVPRDFEKALETAEVLAPKGYPHSQFTLGLLYAEGTGVERDYGEAAKWLERAAFSGHLAARNYLGSMRELGKGFPVDKAAAYADYLEAAKGGDPRARMNAGRLLLSGEGVEASPGEAREWFLLAADDGIPGAMYALGLIYLKGLEVEKSVPEAERWFRLGAENGSDEAEYELARMFFSDESETVTPEEALSLMTRAARAGNPAVQYALGVVLYGGEKIPENKTEAVRWWMESAEGGHPGAFFALGNVHRDGDGVEADASEAFKWFRKAAERGDPKAQFNLGVMHHNGEGVAASAVEALKWYERASERGSAEASHAICLIYANGDGVEQDRRTAAKYCRKAAEKGEPDAMFVLGMMYGHGDGRKKNVREAAKWLGKAAENGHPHAGDELALLLETPETETEPETDPEAGDAPSAGN